MGAIDIGTNSIRLLVADFPDRNGGAGRVVTLARAGEACRLGRGLGQSGLIDPDIAGQAADLAGAFVRRARSFKVSAILAAGTAALRSAANGAEVADLIGARCGIPVRVLSGDEEAQLVYRAVILGLGRPVKNNSCVVFDLGGGSTEVVSGVGERAGRWASLPFGAVSLTERFVSGDPATSEELDALRDAVRGEIARSCGGMPETAPVLAGVGGTITVLGMLDRGLEAYDPAQIEGWGVERSRLADAVARLEATTHDERRRLPAMGEGRADIVVAGALVVEALMDRFPSPALVCSTQGLRYGLARLAAEEARSGRAEGPNGR